MATMVYNTVAEVKKAIGMKPTEKIQFFHYKSGTANAKAPNGRTFKAQGGIDTSKPVTYMYNSEEGFDEGCFINPAEAVDAGSL